MLRLIVILLALANVGFYAWHAMDAAELLAQRDVERQRRLSEQVAPNIIQMAASAPPASAPSKATSVEMVCLEIGPFVVNQLSSAQVLLYTVLPSERWIELKTETPPVWIVGVTPEPEGPRKDQQDASLRDSGLAVQALNDVPKWGRMFSLGKFSSRLNAEKNLKNFQKLGLRQLKVVELTPALLSYTFRVERVDVTTQEKLQKLHGNDALRERNFKACPAP